MPSHAKLHRPHTKFLQGVSIAGYASPVLATIGMSVRLSICHTLTLCENDAT